MLTIVYKYIIAYNYYHTASPLVPQMKSSFHAKLEVKEQTYGPYHNESPIYDLNIHYEYESKLSRYVWPTTGYPSYISVFGDTTLAIISDFNSLLSYWIDLEKQNCSIYSIDPEFNDMPASRVEKSSILRITLHIKYACVKRGKRAIKISRVVIFPYSDYKRCMVSWWKDCNA